MYPSDLKHPLIITMPLKIILAVCTIQIQICYISRVSIALLVSAVCTIQIQICYIRCSMSDDILTLWQYSLPWLSNRHYE